MANFSFRLFLGLLFGIQSLLYAEGQDGMLVKYALIDQQVNLTCNLNSTGDVTWLYLLDNAYNSIYTCQENQNRQCARNNRAGRSLTDFDFQATRSNDMSVLSLTITQYDGMEHDFKCKLGSNILQKYLVKLIDLGEITPSCNVTPTSSDENGVGSMTLSCEVNTVELDVSLTLEGIALNISDDSTGSSQRIEAKTLYFNNFSNIYNASCNAYFSGIELMRYCTYPNIVKAQHNLTKNGLIVTCDYESDVYHWHLFSSDGKEEDIKNRSGIQDGGRSRLIRYISERDVGKVVVCRTNEDNKTNKGTFCFTVISQMSRDNNNSSSEDPTTTLSAHRHPYMVLTFLFFVLWILTTVVCGALLKKKMESGTSS